MQDLLSGQITFDSNLVSTLFNPDEPFGSPSLGLGDFYGAGNNQAGGNLAITSSTEPSLFEMPDLSDNMTSIGGTSGTNSIGKRKFEVRVIHGFLKLVPFQLRRTLITARTRTTIMETSIRL